MSATILVSTEEVSTIRSVAEQGPAGPPGLVLTAGPPDAGIGLPGQMAFDPDTGLLYGPRGAADWPAAPVGAFAALPAGGPDLLLLL